MRVACRVVYPALAVSGGVVIGIGIGIMTVVPVDPSSGRTVEFGGIAAIVHIVLIKHSQSSEASGSERCVRRLNVLLRCRSSHRPGHHHLGFAADRSPRKRWS